MSGAEVLEQKSRGNSIPGTSAKKSRSFTMTIWSDELLEKVKATDPQYICWAPEKCPNTGRFHWQAYAYYHRERHLSAMGKLFGSDGRVFASDGNASENRKYVFGPYSKNGKEKPENPDAQELGTLPAQGKRNDLKAFHEDIKQGKRGRDLSVDHLECRAKYPKLEQTLINEEDEQRAIQMFKDGFCPEVHVRWGEPGTGKSRYVYEKHPTESIYELNLGDGCNKSVWWDGYRGQEVILINDFDGELGWKYLLRLLDRYPFRMQIKGSHCWRLCKYIYITSNDPPERWYAQHQSGPLMRRLTSTTEVK